MALREAAELVALVHFQHVGLEQRIVHAAGEADAVVRERVAVELQVLADFPAVGPLEPGLSSAMPSSRSSCAGAPA